MRCETNLSDVFFYTHTFIGVNVFIFSMQRRKANKKSWLCLLTECDVTGLPERSQGWWMLSSLLFSSLGLLKGAKGDLQFLPAASTPAGLSFSDALSFRLSSWPPCSFSFSLFLLPPIIYSHPLPFPHGGAAELNAKKRREFTYITSTVQLMSWSVSAV